jgi:hypothetical protein
MNAQNAHEYLPLVQALADGAIHENTSWFNNGAEYREREGYIEARNNLNPDWVAVDTALQFLTPNEL